MKSLLTTTAICLLGLCAAAQSTVNFSSVGTPQAVPDPLGGTAGVSALWGYYAPAAGGQPARIRFILNGIPGGYNGAQTQEAVWFVLDLGSSALPGTPLLGGTLLVPNIAPQTFLVGSSTYMGPGDVVPTGGTWGGIPAAVNNGRWLDLNGLFTPAAIGVNMTVQGALIDPVLNRAFTSNAMNFTVM